MITSGEWLNPTRASGLLAYGTAVTCCAFSWIRSNDRRATQLAAGLTLIECLLLLDIAFSWRWMLHSLGGAFAERHDEYAARRLPQVIAISILGALLLSGVLATWGYFRGRMGAILAVSGVLLSLVLWCVEVVSLHAMDSVLYRPLGSLYRPLGSVMTICIFWILAALMASMGVLMEAFCTKSVESQAVESLWIK